MLGAYRARLEEEPVLVVPRYDDVDHHLREMAGDGALLGGQVVRFNWLFREIAGRTGYRGRRVSRLQQELIAAEAVRRAKLEVLARSAERAGFARAAVRFFRELERARVEPDGFEEALARWAGRGPRRRYAIEIASLYAGYRERLDAAGLVDDELFAARAVDRLRADPFRWGRTPVFVYGFDDFTDLELDALAVLAQRAEADVTVSLPYERGRLAFKAVAPVFERLRALAVREPEELPAVDAHYSPGSRPALHHLERSLFEPGSPDVVDAAGAVTLLTAGGERAEAELVAAEVLKLLRAGTEPGDIAVVYRRPRDYATLLEQVFDAYGIPHSLERWVRFAHTALGRGMLALLRAARPDGSADDLLAYLRSPGVLRVAALADRLESEVRQEGARSARRAADLFEEVGGFHLGELERIRRARGEELLDEVLARLEHLLAAPWRRQAHILRGAELADARAYEAARGALGELRVLQGAGVKLDMAGVAEALERLEVREGELPDPRRVQITEPEAVRARRFAAVFACGLQEGEWPASAPGEPFLSDDDRREIADRGGLALPLREERVERERYLFYSTLSRAEERVFLSSRYSDEDGNPQAASFFVDDVRDLFGESLAEPLRRSLSDVTWSPAAAPTAKEWERAIAARGPRRVEKPGSHLSAAELADWLAARGGFSASALEAFSECPVRWLVERVLDPNVLEPDPEYMVRGSYAHRVLELTFAELRERTGSMRVRPESLAVAETILLEKMRASEHEFPLSPSQTRVRAAVRRLEFDLIRYLRHEAARDTGLEPAEVELKFGFEDEALSLPPLKIEPGGVEIRGKIDRVDRANGHALVIDYKSGKNVHGVAKWADRHVIQAPLYMLAVKELMGLEPIGGVYQPLKGEDLRPRGVVSADHKDELGEGYVGTDWKPGDELRATLASAKATVVEVVERMRRGEIHPTPDCCSNGGGCRYPSICREEGHR